MRVLLVNGSPREAGCTYTALMEVAGALERSGVEWEMFQAGAQPIRGCTGCGRCRQTEGKCVFSDRVNDLIDRAREADGFVFGTPVHYAAASGAITSLLDRAFYANSAAFCGKPAGVIASCRRAGSTGGAGTIDEVPHHFADAGGVFAILDHGAWQFARGSAQGSRGHADHARAGV